MGQSRQKPGAELRLERAEAYDTCHDSPTICGLYFGPCHPPSPPVSGCSGSESSSTLNGWGQAPCVVQFGCNEECKRFLSYPMGCIVLPQLLSHSFSDLGILSSTKLREYAAVGEVLAKKTMVDFAEVHVNKLDNPPLPLLLSALGLAKKYIVEPGP